MNDELTWQVVKALNTLYGSDWSNAETIIALVRADERRKLREALLSDEAVDAACSGNLAERFYPEAWGEVLQTPIADLGRVANGIHFDTGEPDEVRAQERAALTAALAAIGLSESEVAE